ncbi:MULTISPECIES: metalloregulator ArsR/SmtB family transcription factor [unclassified Chelatococcus]|uniref:helix-turn-helix transcriptional regulator n=1 Tax=unclassified Chelatococcus TaxID=2638111 RepID=UPI001BCFF94F|nr:MULTISPECIES: metalloregulator ArsR/SmtB family transcription factor [unclassified Chelatococcus]CAH1672912.1 Transcriptional regulator [Hyphomicrobiales bacterium]MBS7738891.1 transcriptional regulator [Chelatococcus sp. HY11]MBX3547043.1 transcriptional regulator [Chelatococcus sp.]MCO5076580.1 transcriptional regulator [Chelatococcus sp.]CAH1674855.1 Transcriptional regulator [Hyphomicrobiales bacterium]
MSIIGSERLQGRPSPDRFLVLLKTRGPLTAAELGRALGTTGENARQQLSKLAADGLVETEAVARGVGRPAQYWRLTAFGNTRFPDAHAELTAGLLRNIRDLLGADALERLVSAREEEMRAAYRAELRPIKGLEARIAALAAIRTREGYMAEYRKADDGDGWLLIENHCPICAAASTCQGFCRAELAIFREMLGPDCSIERMEHIVLGARRCAYRIRADAGRAMGREP